MASPTCNKRPIFVVTHPRSCSTAFERVFMTRRDVLECSHEPFGDAFYYGPERLSERYEADEAARIQSGFADVTYKDVLDRLNRSAPEGKRLFIKDMAYYMLPADGEAKIALSLAKDVNGHSNGIANGVSSNGVSNGVANGNGTPNGLSNGGQTKNGGETYTEHGNPTVLPLDVLRQFHFTFLIRHPRRSIPSYYRCTAPPQNKVTGWSGFFHNEAGYSELRKLFDFLRLHEVVGPHKAGEPAQPRRPPPHTAANGRNGNGDVVQHADNNNNNNDGRGVVSITIVDADDLLDKPATVIEAFCNEVGLDYTPDMLRWEDDDNQEYAAKAFEKWNGWHDDVLGSTYLKPRSHGAKTVTTESEDDEWREKYGEEGRREIRACVDANVADYEYLKSFAIRV